MSIYEDLREKTVLITGGANGIGRAMVEAFVAQGAATYFCDVDRAKGQELAQSLSGQAQFKVVDLTKEAQVRRWVAQIAQARNKIDVLINNAASDPRIPFEKMTAKQWDSLFALNLRAQFLTAQTATPHMDKGGSIINFSSITFTVSPKDMAAYVATKAGIQGLTRSLARDLGAKGIRVNTISPGWIMTDRQLKQFVTPAVKKMIREVQCIPDLLQPSEIAQIALFLSSQASSAITGQEILADRGWAHS